MGVLAMDKKIISVSNKRQITLPLKIYNELNIQNEVECYSKDGKIIIEPLKNQEGYFAEQILEDLVSEGYSGKELLVKFKERNTQMKKAVNNMVEEALELSKKGKLNSIEDVFGE